ncbi:hypothetical protein [Chryseobacterium oranimense]|uniref:hypothetical protein n=1 Tax=Chryseobacterium oranimense TaxID=421058 RepID=UPI0031E4153A
MHSENELLEGIQLIMPMEFLEEFRQQIKTKDEIEAVPKSRLHQKAKLKCILLNAYFYQYRADQAIEY